MNSKKDRLLRTYRIGFFILVFISFFILLFFGIGMKYYQILYHEAIEQGAENTLTAIEMTAACISLGNFTQEEVLEKTIDMFVLNKLRGGEDEN